MNASDPQITRFTRHGPVRVAPEGTHLQHADGTPFFYLADTAWNGPLLATDAEWADYLADRVAKGFTAVQFIPHAPWSGAMADERGDTAFIPPAGEDRASRTRLLERMESRVAAIAAAGLLSVPVLAWAAPFPEGSRYNLGSAAPEPLLTAVIKEQVDRFKHYPILWLLGGDGRYDGFFTSRKWKRVGRQIFGAGSHAPVALHPVGLTWPYRRFRREPWLDVAGYQSSHSDATKTLRWLLAGPPAREWRTLRKPFLNLEPCYEGIRNWGGTGPITHREVRRATYASLLNAPTAGVAYGAHGLWSWERDPREPLNHRGCGVARPWREALQFPGSHDVGRLAALFTSVDWWRLRPAPQLLIDNGDADGGWPRFVSCAATDALDLAVCYLPAGGAVALGRMPSYAEWFDPRTGARTPAAAGARSFSAPTADDWVLLLRNLQ